MCVLLSFRNNSLSSITESEMALPDFDFDGTGDLGENIYQVAGCQAPCGEARSPLSKHGAESEEENDTRVETE
jgi:hypothetical protein